MGICKTYYKEGSVQEINIETKLRKAFGNKCDDKSGQAGG